jgi:preprotein translocase subunit SecE
MDRPPTAAPSAQEPGWLSQTADFLAAARLELRKVTWPTRDELIKATRMILVLSILLGIIIGLMDVVLQKILVAGVARLAGR